MKKSVPVQIVCLYLYLGDPEFMEQVPVAEY